MLVQFSVENWRSILDKQTLSFVKTQSKELLDNTFEVPKLKKSLLKSIAIWGPNAGGKSNFLKAIAFMKHMVRTSASEMQHGDSIHVTPFLLDNLSKDAPSEFEIIFIAEGVRYNYGFSATTERVISEWLYAYPNGVAQTWFNRTWSEESQQYNWQRGLSLKGTPKEKSSLEERTRKEALFLSTAVQFNCEQLFPLFDWFKKILQVNISSNFSSANTEIMCHTSEEGKKSILNFLKSADLDIDGLNIQAKKFSREDLPKDMPEKLTNRVLEDLKDKDIISVKTCHTGSDGKDVLFEMKEESDGTQKIFNLAAYWINTIENGQVLVVDELNIKLHPRLVKFLIHIIQDKATNKKGAQLLFSTHDTSNVDSTLLRRDQIWFCQKNASKATVLTQLVEYKTTNRRNLEKDYLNGLFAAIPAVSEYKI